MFGIVTIFISALGNRPQGSKWLYYGLSILFSILMALMIFMGAFAIKTATENYSINKFDADNTIFRDMVIATASIYGVYIASSLIHMDRNSLLTFFSLAFSYVYDSISSTTSNVY
jgi:chitin synthase